ncbi:MAG TPA: alpha/beta hydrolase-fold protein, partial [Polyangiaceae bacterium]
MSQAKDADDPYGTEQEHPHELWYAAMELHGVRPGSTIELDPDALAWPRPFSSATAGSWRVSARLLRDGTPLLRGAVVERVFDPPHAGTIDLRLDAEVPAMPPVVESGSIKVLRIESKHLSAFYGRPVFLEGVVELPPSYATDSRRRYPTAYMMSGFGGTLAYQAGRDAELMKQRSPEHYPEMIWVRFSEMLPTGNHVFADSLGDGPWGTALVEELIPELERKYRAIPAARARLLTGQSSGAWAALWLQITHPDFFGGAWPVAPDPVDFRSWLGANVTPGSTDNVFVTREGKPRNLWRDRGQEIFSVEEYVRLEQVLAGPGALDTFNWVFSPRGPSGLPERLFDPTTGVQNPEVQKAWARWDVHRVLEDGWTRLGPKLAGKLHVFVGSDDSFHLNESVALLCDFLAKKGSGGACELVPGKNHFDV